MKIKPKRCYKKCLKIEHSRRTYSKDHADVNTTKYQTFYTIRGKKLYFRIFDVLKNVSFYFKPIFSYSNLEYLTIVGKLGNKNSNQINLFPTAIFILQCIRPN